MLVRRFEDRDAGVASAIIRRNLLEVITADSPLAQMQTLADRVTPARTAKPAGLAHTYVACDGGTVVGTGTVDSFQNSATESMLPVVFVAPEYHGRGAGRLICETLEEDELFLRTDTVHVFATITAYGFYEKMGYGNPTGTRAINEKGECPMVKFRALHD